MIESGVVETANPRGHSAVVLVCEDASNYILDVFGNLGFGDGQVQDHIAWDPGALAVAKKISVELDTTLIAPSIFPHVYDYNRLPSGEMHDVGLGILCDDDPRLAEALTGATAATRPEVVTRLNQPYDPADGVTHPLVDQAPPRGLLNVMIEICNDLIDEVPQQVAIRRWLADCLRLALSELKASQPYEGEWRTAGS